MKQFINFNICLLNIKTIYLTICFIILNSYAFKATKSNMYLKSDLKDNNAFDYVIKIDYLAKKSNLKCSHSKLCIKVEKIIKDYKLLSSYFEDMLVYLLDVSYEEAIIIDVLDKKDKSYINTKIKNLVNKKDHERIINIYNSKFSTIIDTFSNYYSITKLFYTKKINLEEYANKNILKQYIYKLKFIYNVITVIQKYLFQKTKCLKNVSKLYYKQTINSKSVFNQTNMSKLIGKIIANPSPMLLKPINYFKKYDNEFKSKYVIFKFDKGNKLCRGNSLKGNKFFIKPYTMFKIKKTKLINNVKIIYLECLKDDLNVLNNKKDDIIATFKDYIDNSDNNKINFNSFGNFSNVVN